MKRNLFSWGVLATGAIAALSTSPARGQSVDSLLDKLVDKGVLTTREAKELKDEADDNFAKAYQVKSGLPDWVTTLKLGGDFRGRYEAFYSDTSLVDRSRFRYRLRLGVTATIRDSFEVGTRLSSSDPVGSFGGDPISGNTTLQDNGSKKFVYLDLAYAKWTPVNNRRFASTFTIGKMENPFVFSDMVFDGDYTLEGAGVNLTYNLNDQHALKFNAGAFVLDEFTGQSEDPYLGAIQARFESKWAPHLQSSLGVALLSIAHDEGLTTNNVPGVNRGNTRRGVTGGPLAVNFNPVVADAAITYSLESFPYYSGAFPIRLGGDFMYNPAADEHEEAFSAGMTFGKAGKRGTWELSYRYKYLGADAWYEELVDSDFGGLYQGTLDNSGVGRGYGAGTNTRGHIVKASYSPFDSLTLSATMFWVRLIHPVGVPPDGSSAADASDIGRLQVDAVWKF